MTRFSIPISNILGLSYYRYELSVNDHNPSIDATIMISCRVTNVLGTPIPEKTVTLYQNGSSLSTGITNNQGIVTYNVTLSEWGLQCFTVGDASLQVNVRGWRRVQQHTNYDIFCNGEYVQINIHHGTSATVPKTYDYTLPAGYYPRYNIGTISSTIGDDGVHYATINATTTGAFSVKLRRNTSNSSISTVYGMLFYPI